MAIRKLQDIQLWELIEILTELYGGTLDDFAQELSEAAWIFMSEKEREKQLGRLNTSRARSKTNQNPAQAYEGDFIYSHQTISRWISKKANPRYVPKAAYKYFAIVSCLPFYDDHENEMLLALNQILLRHNFDTPLDIDAILREKNSNVIHQWLDSFLQSLIDYAAKPRSAKQSKALCKDTEKQLSVTFQREQSSNAAHVFSPCSYCFYDESDDPSLTFLLENAFTDNRNVFAICGQRGIGKTELARAFCRACGSRSDLRSELRYKNIHFASYVSSGSNGLRETILSIPCTGLSDSDDPFLARIAALKKLPKPSLLVIDNFDAFDDFDAVLSDRIPATQEPSDYYRLRTCGIDILFTSQIDLHEVETLRSMHLKFTDTAPLTDLFQKISGFKNDSEEIGSLIENQLCSNTYLVVLCAKLATVLSLDTIRQAYEDMNLSSLYDPIRSMKDGVETTVPLMQYYQAMFRLSSFADNEDTRHLLFALALLPLQGMDYESFFLRAFAPDEQPRIRSAFRRLRDAFWAFVSDDRRVYIHPAIRDLVLEYLPDFSHDYVQRYTKDLGHRIHVQVYSEEMAADLSYAQAAHLALKKKGAVNIDHAFMLANICSDYDIMKQIELAYPAGVEGLALLDQLDEAALSQDGLLDMANAYSMIAYALMHKKNAPGSQRVISRALSKAEELLTRLLATAAAPEDAFSIQKSLTILHGNQGAYHITCAEYEKALEYHMLALQERQKIYNEEATPDNNIRIAAAYKGIATDCFFLARLAPDSKKQELWERSCQCHNTATAIYAQELGDTHFDTTLAALRCCGAEIGRLKYILEKPSGAESCLEDIRSTAERIATYLKNAALCLADMPAEREIENLLTRTNDLAALLAQHRICVEAFDAAVSEILAQFADQSPQ